MSTGYVYSAYGYDEKDGERGHREFYAGLEWWFPLNRVTAIPNFALKELDHNASTPSAGEKGQLIYLTAIVPGQRIIEELCDKQLPRSNRSMGILPIEGRPTGRTVRVLAGWTTEGQRIYDDVPEREATKSEVAEAERLAKSYKEAIIQEYFDSKRQRMTGGRGSLFPSKIVRTFMDELGIDDIDDVNAHAKAGGIPLDLIKMILESKVTSQEELNGMLRDAVETVRKSGKAQVAPTKLSGNKHYSPSLGLAEHKAAYEAAEKAREAAEAEAPVEAAKE